MPKRVLVGALIICAVGDELIVAHPNCEMGTEVVFVLIIGPVIYLLANSIYKYVTCRMVPLSHLIAVGVLLLLILWPYHVSLLLLNVLITSVFVFVIVFDIIYPNKGYKLNSKG